jgi:hypothetical protein
VVARRSARLAGRTGDRGGRAHRGELQALLRVAGCCGDPYARWASGPGHLPVSGRHRVGAEHPRLGRLPAARRGRVRRWRGGVPPRAHRTPLVRVDSDRACCILGDAWCGSARGARNAIFITVGTGIGAGIMVDGVVLRGARDIAGAIGWLALDREYRDGYADMGCFEYHAAGPGLVRESPATSRAMQWPPDLTTAALFDAYDAGDDVARRVIDDAVVHTGAWRWRTW